MYSKAKVPPKLSTKPSGVHVSRASPSITPDTKSLNYFAHIPDPYYVDDILADSASFQFASSCGFITKSIISSSSEDLNSLRNPSFPSRLAVRTGHTPGELGSFAPSNFLSTPADSLDVPRSSFSTKKKSLSSPVLNRRTSFLASPPPYSSLDRTPVQHMYSDAEDDDQVDAMIYTSLNGSSRGVGSRTSNNLRMRLFGGGYGNGHARNRNEAKPICTTPGRLGAGETETETDEPSRHLPTARIVLPSRPVVPPTTIQERLTPLLFEFSRLLSIVPAIIGTLYNLYRLYQPPTSAPNGRLPPQRVDYFISALWAILTGYQCLSLTTGLLTRWRLYYPPLSTLVRLLALQSICWPATHFTLTIFEHEKRPVIVWALIGTTTCTSRSVQIWVTSNLWWEKREGKDGEDASAGDTPPVVVSATEETRQAYWRRWGEGGKWGGRRWDWKEVGVKCVLPAGILYFIMAWAEQLRREFSGC